MADLELPNVLQRVETNRSGPFKFQVGVDADAVNVIYQRVTDAYERFQSSPLSQVANQLEREVVVSSIFGTNSIEGGKLSEAETADAYDLDPAAVQEVEQRRAVNIKAAYNLATEQAAQTGWSLSLDYIKEVHRLITDQLPDDRNVPGQFRDNPEGVLTHVGNQEHGGRYKPPQNIVDIQTLMTGLIDWNNELIATHIPAVIRAPLVHYYYELIHPFWDGNGRVGRVLEASILIHEGFRYAPFAQARYYLDHIHQYFTLFNVCRNAADKKQDCPNTPFVDFYLQGMLSSINRLHDQVNRLVEASLFKNQLADSLAKKDINKRQYAIAEYVLRSRTPVPLRELRKEVWYAAMYASLTGKTKQRDLVKLQDLRLIQTDNKRCMWSGHATIPAEFRVTD